MKKYLILAKNRLKRPKYYIPTVAFAVLVAIAIIWTGWGTGADASLVEVKIGDLTQEVSVTGQTKPMQNVDLSFERGGRVVSVPAAVGTRVAVGQLLVALDDSELRAQLTQAEAGLQAQEAKLAELEKGTRAENLQITEAQTGSTKVALDNARKTLADSITDAYSKSDDAIHNRADKFFFDPRTMYARLNFDTSDQELRLSIGNARVAAEKALTSWPLIGNNFSADQGADYEALATEAKANLDKVKRVLDLLAGPVNSLSPNPVQGAAQIDGYKADLSQARSAVSAAISGLNGALDGYRSARSSYEVALRQLELGQAGYTNEQIAMQEAAVKQARGAVDSVRSQLSKMYLFAPIAGIVTKQEAKPGEYLAPGQQITSIIADKDLEVEANISEVDIGKVMVGNKVNISLDAFPSETFSGKVTYIDPAETLVDGVVNFKIKVIFDKSDERFKSGLTANLGIETATKKMVTVLPQYAVIENDQGTFVKIGTGNAAKEVPIKTGLRGRDNLVEIISGVKAGDMVANVGVKTAK